MRTPCYRSTVSLLWMLAALTGCGGDDGPSDGGGGGGGGIGNVPLGPSQLSTSQRAAAADQIIQVAQSVAATDAAASAALTALAGALQAEGWVTGVDANSGLGIVAAGSQRASLMATGRWAVFGAELGVLMGLDPQTNLPIGSQVRGIVMLRDTTVVVAYKSWPLADAFEPSGVFPTAGTGAIFEGSGGAWTAVAGGVVLTSADSLISQCSGVNEAGITDCNNASFANGSLGISTSEPVPGTGASGSYSVGFGSMRVRGYVLIVDCQQSSRC